MELLFIFLVHMVMAFITCTIMFVWDYIIISTGNYKFRRKQYPELSTKNTYVLEPDSTIGDWFDSTWVWLAIIFPEILLPAILIQLVFNCIEVIFKFLWNTRPITSIKNFCLKIGNIKIF